MNARRILGTGVAALSLSAVALTVGAAPALGAFDAYGHAPSPTSSLEPAACFTPGMGMSGIAIASTHAPLSCTSSTGHTPGFIKID